MELSKTIPFYFRQPSLDSVSLPELEKAIDRFPYCSALHYLLLKKHQLQHHPDFEKQLHTTYLYFPNIYQLHTVLHQREEIVAVEEVAAVEEFAAVIVPQVPKIEELPEEEELPLLEEVTPEPMLRTDLLLKESPIPIPSLKDISPQSDELPLFEPYHTIDYFASQGIKLSQELPLNDRLGRQLRSFTDWIKTMKKLPQAELQNQLDEAGLGEKIAAMAAGSVVAADVLTETMAEVLVKQGNFGGAIELYRKLSLVHPDKSAYFAARIDQLNKLR
jgi:hypothetical protein